MHLAPTADFGALLDETLPIECRTVRIASERGGSEPMLLSHVRVTEDGVRIVYIANMDQKPFTGTVSVAGVYETAAEADAFSGDISVIGFTQNDARAEIPVVIRPGEGRFLLFVSIHNERNT